MTKLEEAERWLKESSDEGVLAHLDSGQSKAILDEMARLRGEHSITGYVAHDDAKGATSLATIGWMREKKADAEATKVRDCYANVYEVTITARKVEP